MSHAELIERTSAFIRESFLYTKPAYAIDPDEPLIESGIIDSMGIIELVAFVESEFGIAVGDEEIVEENLGSVQAIARYVAGKRRLTQAA